LFNVVAPTDEVAPHDRTGRRQAANAPDPSVPRISDCRGSLTDDRYSRLTQVRLSSSCGGRQSHVIGFGVVTMRVLVIGGLVALGATRLAAPQSAAPVVDVQTLGPRVGSSAPTFVLLDQIGRPRSLESILGPKGAVLVFFRSADW
jgi:hypothetical protein